MRVRAAATEGNTSHTTVKPVQPRVVVSMVAIAFASLASGAAQSPPSQRQTAPAVEVMPVQGNVYMLTGAGGNVTIQVGKDGAVLVDAGLEAAAPRVLEEVQKLTRGPLLYIINTHFHPDHTGGNEFFARRSPQNQFEQIGGRVTSEQAVKIIAHENVLNRMSQAAESGAATPRFGLPVDEFFTPFKDLRVNGEAIFVYHEPRAHTDGDSVVLFRASDVISAGDVFTPDGYPFIDLEAGGSVQGEIDALNHLLELTVPGHTQEAGTYVIPGHGRLCDEADVVEYRDMVVIVRDRIQDLIKKGRTLEQVEAARPSLDYDAAYVSPGSFVTPEKFVESIYKSLARVGK